MEIVVTLLRLYFFFAMIVMSLYSIRQIVFSYNRLYGRQKIAYRDVYDSRLPSVSVIVPLYNEELVLDTIVSSLLQADYDTEKLEIILIDDNSTDDTAPMLDELGAKYPALRILHRGEDVVRGKPAALNDGLSLASGEVVVVFDADYKPPRNLIKKLAMSFSDPCVGAVMGRVIPINTGANTLTRLLGLERSGGYQVDQQARYNLGLLPQYGGTVGGFRRQTLLDFGGFNEHILAEDTELTYRLFLEGWRIVYDNSAECYEESPETWQIRGKQIRRWSCGHNQVLFAYLPRVLLCRHCSFSEKLDALFLLFIFAAPIVWGLALAACLALFFLDQADIFSSIWTFLWIGALSAWGNFSPFYEVATGALLDGITNDLLLLPFLSFSFYFYFWFIFLGFFDAVRQALTRKTVRWAKTDRAARRARDGGD